MATYTQADRPVKVTTPLGADALLLVGFTGTEGISQLFQFQASVLADNKTDVPFDKLLGQKITLTFALPEGKTRLFNGICNRISQGERDIHFTEYQIEIVPQLWLLTKRIQSRIFQHLNVPDILKKVLQGIDVAWEIEGTFQPRNYCVQYRESDFDFASRLMEEEGIYYFFKHSADGHKLVVANTPKSHPPLPGASKILFERLVGDAPKDNRIFSWTRAQEVRSGKVTLWDHNFQLPGKHLEADAQIKDSFQAGTVNHKFKVAGNDQLEIYDYPGGYAGRFDGINRGGNEQPAELQKIFEDNKRVTALRMQQETVAGLTVRSDSTSGNITSGHRFTLEKHFNADGDYVVTSVEHTCTVSATYRSGDKEGFNYRNEFSCIPASVPFRPEQTTPRPVMRGTQTAVVVGPAGEEIFTDKYGRVKVQFHWDREGKYDADSSCWIRVATNWAGKQWGGVHIPRIGQEVIVDFLEGDPDAPIIVGNVYNADQMPPAKLPDKRMVSGLKSNTYKGQGYNEMTMDDTKGKELINVHGQYDMSTVIEHDDTQHIKNDRKITVDGTHTETIKKDTTIKITEGKLDHDVEKGTATFHVKGDVKETFDATQKTTVAKDIVIKSNETLIHILAAKEIKLEVGLSKILMKDDGSIEISCKNLAVKGSESVNISGMSITSEASADNNTKGNIVVSNGTATNTVKGGMVMLNP